MFTSMGYYDEETDRQILTQILKLVTPQGILVIDMANRDWLVRHFQARDVTYGENGRVMVTERSLDMERSRMFNVWRYYRQHGEDLRHLGTIASTPSTS
jgi:hypothetical protein